MSLCHLYVAQHALIYLILQDHLLTLQSNKNYFNEIDIELFNVTKMCVQIDSRNNFYNKTCLWYNKINLNSKENKPKIL